MLRLAFDFIITWRETRTRPNAYEKILLLYRQISLFGGGSTEMYGSYLLQNNTSI